jgi:hypothetical protein
MGAGASRCQKTAGAHRKGSSGTKTREGESPDVASDPLVSRKVVGGETSREQQRPQDPRRGPEGLEHVAQEDAGDQHAETARVSFPAAETGLHREEERQAPTSGNSDDARPGNAGALRAGADPGGRDAWRPELLRISGVPRLRRCNRAVLHLSGQKVLAALGAGGGHPFLLR